MSEHEEFMRLALRLARKGRGKVEPNPMVGAVVVRDGAIVGRGYHRRFGGPHAEVEAIRDAGSACEGATIYVSLEPCSHAGKTPPCVGAIIRAGFAEVVFAVEDPNPVTRGKGAQQLRDAGFGVVAGVLAEEAQALNAPFFKLMTHGMPYVTAKWAMTLDGKIATESGHSQWISSERSRKLVHRERHLADAILVGIGTVLADDPLLTCRLHEGRNPARVVLDSQARLPLDSELVKSVDEAPILVAATTGTDAQRVAELRARGCEVIMSDARAGRTDLSHLLAELGRRQMTHLLVEGGQAVPTSFFEGKLVDRVLAFVAPKIIGGQQAATPVAGRGAPSIGEGIALANVRIRKLGTDLLVEGLVPQAPVTTDH